MRKLLFGVLLLVLLLLLVSCFFDEGGVKKNEDNPLPAKYTYEEIADMTFNELIDAIQLENVAKIVSMFAPSVQNDVELLQPASDLIEFIHGEIVFISSSIDSGVSMTGERRKGKHRENIDSSFTVQTTSGTYYVAVEECIENEINPQNVGVIAICIIDDVQWNKDYVYRIGGRPIQGIQFGRLDEGDGDQGDKGTVLLSPPKETTEPSLCPMSAQIKGVVYSAYKSVSSKCTAYGFKVGVNTKQKRWAFPFAIGYSRTDYSKPLVLVEACL